MTLGAVVFSLSGRRRHGAAPIRSPGSWTSSRCPGWFVVVFMLFVDRPALRDQQPRPVLLGRDAAGDGPSDPPRSRRRCSTVPSAWPSPSTRCSTRSSRRCSSDFVTIVIVWIAPWCAIFLTDWYLLRGGRYDARGLQDDGPASPYWATWASPGPRSSPRSSGDRSALGVARHLPADVARTSITVHTSGADASIFLGLLVGRARLPRPRRAGRSGVGSAASSSGPEPLSAARTCRRTKRSKERERAERRDEVGISAEGVAPDAHLR